MCRSCVQPDLFKYFVQCFQTREERKMEAIMKAFEKMEKRNARKASVDVVHKGKECPNEKVKEEKDLKKEVNNDKEKSVSFGVCNFVNIILKVCNIKHYLHLLELIMQKMLSRAKLYTIEEQILTISILQNVNYNTIVSQENVEETVKEEPSEVKEEVLTTPITSPEKLTPEIKEEVKLEPVEPEPEPIKEEPVEDVSKPTLRERPPSCKGYVCQPQITDFLFFVNISHHMGCKMCIITSNVLLSDF